MPGLVQLRSEFAGKVEVIGMHVGKATDADVEKIVKAQKLPYPVVRGEALAEYKSYGIKGLPGMVVIDESGTIQFVGKADEGEKFAHQLLAGGPTSGTKAPSAH